MEPERRPRRWRQRSKDPEVVVAEDARTIHDLSNDLLWQILLGLDSPLWLIRASCAYTRWRRVVTGDDADQGRTFLRLASSLHPPTIVGQYHNHDVDHLFVPSSPLPAAIDISRFAVDDRILQKSHWTWHVADCHGGLVLLRRISEHIEHAPSLVVYDPLTRRHHAINSPPLVKEAADKHGLLDISLLDGGNGDISISNFKVIYRFLATRAGGPATCVFSTDNGWGENWSFQRQPADAATGSLGQYAGRVDGCLYVGLQMGSVIALDNASLLFSQVELPIRIRLDTSSSGSFRRLSTFTVVHSGGGHLGPTTPERTTTSSIVHVRGVELELFRRVHGSGDWVLEHNITNLSEKTRGLSTCLDKCMRVEWRTMVDAIAEDGAGLAILSARSWSGDNKRWFFSINVHTMEMRVLPEDPNRVLPNERSGRKIFNYTLPTIPQHQN